MEQSRVRIAGGGGDEARKNSFARRMSVITMDPNTGKILVLVKQCNARGTWKTDEYFLYHLLDEHSSVQILGFDF